MAENNTFVGRMIGAAMLDIPTYEAVEHDTTLTTQAGAVVLLNALATGIAFAGASVIGSIVASLVGWFAVAGLVYMIGTKLFGATATWGEVLRTLGFAASPGILAVFAIIPLLGWIIAPIVGIWGLVAAVVAIRQALDVSTGRAVMSGILGLLAWGLVRAAIGGVI